LAGAGRKDFDRISPVRLHKPHDGEDGFMSTSDAYNQDLMHLIRFSGFEDRDNITLFPAYSHPDVPAGESLIMEFIDPKGQGLFFTTNGFTVPGHGFIPYKSVGHADWGSISTAGPNYKEFVQLTFHDRPTIEFHVGKHFSMSLDFFIMKFSRAKKWQAKQSQAGAPG
jgi:hypothetical protein